MRGARAYRTAVLGYQGFGNLGDEAILAGIERLIQPLPLRPAFLIGGPSIESVEAFPGAVRIAASRLLPTLPAIRALRSCEVLILGGGGLFNDHWPTVIPRYVSWVLAARLVGTQVAWLGVGVGPIRRRVLRWLTRLAARFSNPVFVRDRDSAALLKGGPQVHIGPDMAFFNPPPPVHLREPVLALIVRPPVTSDPAAVSELERLLVSLAGAGVTAGLQPRIELMAPDVDAPFAKRIGERIRTDLDLAPVIEVLGRTPTEALDRLAGWQLAASVRLHGLILSAVAGVPCLPIAYDPKVTAIASQLGLRDLVLQPTASLDLESVIHLVRLPERQERVARRVAELQGRADRIRDALAVVA